MLRDILKIGNGKDYKHLDAGIIPVFGTGGIMTNVNSFLLDGESVFIGRKGSINKPTYFEGKFWTVDTLFYTHSFKSVRPKFVFYLFENINWLQFNEASGVPSLSKSTIEKIQVFIPKENEQEKILNFLSLLDSKIQTQRKTIENLETLMQGLFQSFDKTNWKNQYLKDILTERRENNTENFAVHSVSVKKGVINQIEYLGRSFAAANTSNYNVVHFGDIIYTKSPTGDFPYGIIKQSFICEKVAVSPLYGVFIPKSKELGTFLHYYFSNPINVKNYLHSLIQKGAKNTINITNQNFLNKEILLPNDDNEINRIANLLTSLQTKLNLETEIQQKLELQKKFLLKNLFV